MKAPDYLELADSSLVAIRACAATLEAAHCDPFQRTGAEKIAARFLNNLPKATRKSILRFLAGTMGVKASLAHTVKTDEILNWALSLVGGKKQFDGIVLGAPNGAVSHLASLLRFPFLTQHYLCAFRGDFPPDDSKAHLDHGVVAAREILKNNPDLEAIVHYDPLHDRFLIIRVNYVRLKLMTFPDIYRKFIKKRVKSGGTVVSIKCTYPWLMYPIDADGGELYYQVGGLGDVSPKEYLDDSERLREYRRREGGDPKSPWGIDGIEPVERPESEWGSVGVFNDEIKQFCDDEGYRFLEIEYDHPDKYSSLVFKLYLEAIKLANSEFSSVQFDCFTHIDPRFNLITHTPSIWLPFICGDSFRYAKRMAKKLPKDLDVFISLHPSFCDPVDLTQLSEWQDLFSGFNSLTLLGIDPEKYPADLSTYTDYCRDSVKAAESGRKRFALAADADMLNWAMEEESEQT